VLERLLAAVRGGESQALVLLGKPAFQIRIEENVMVGLADPLSDTLSQRLIR
jgi:hypothetical protein